MAERSSSASDEAILASLDAAPAAFAVLYRRHAGRLLSELAGRTGDARLAAELLAETFAAALAAAHRFDPELGPAAAWLDGIAAAELAHAERAGTPRDTARRRLGLPPLDAPGEADADAAADPDAGRAPAARFLADLEEELVAAARYLAGRCAARPALPRPPRAAVAAVAAVALLGLVAALALSGGGDAGSAAGERSAAALPEPVRFRLPPMQPLTSCGPPARRPPGDAVRIALLRRPQRGGDELPIDAGRLPIGTFDPRSTRRASVVHVVPSGEVSASGRCGAHVGPGLCLVAGGEFRCFTAVEVAWGRAVARTSAGTLVGVAPDGVARVTVDDDGARAAADVRDNVYAVRSGFPAGEGIELAFHRRGGGCDRTVAPELLSEVALLLDRPRANERLPRAAHEALEHWPIEAIADDGARYWGGGDGIDFWAVPVVPFGAAPCAPAARVCVVAIPGSSSAAAQCDLGRARRGRNWWLGQRFPERAMVFGTVPDGVTGVRLTQHGETAEIAAHDNVFGGSLPWAYEVGDHPRVELLRGDDDAGRLAGLVDAGGPVRDVLGRLRAHGYLTLDLITPAGNVRGRSIVYWWPGRAVRDDAYELAEAAGVERVEPIRDTARIPLPVLETHAPFVVVVGGS